MIRKLLFGLFVFLIGVQGWSASPPTGTISAVGTALNWGGGPLNGASLLPLNCVENLVCDKFLLNVAVPSNKVAQIRFQINWTGLTNDLDLYVFDANGNQWAYSNTGSTSETVRSPELPPGTYTVLTNAFSAVNTVYTGTLTLEAINDPSPPADLSKKPVFGDNTIVDFSFGSGEPFIKADLKDNIFVSVPWGVSTTVSLLWKSNDGGRSFIQLGSPIVRDAVTGPGGGDTHQDVDGDNLFYYVDLSAACVTAAVSTDEGNTFDPTRTNPVACVSDDNPGAAVDDRQWVGAFGNGIAYATWRNFTSSNFWIFKTTNGGQSWDTSARMGTVSQSGPFQVDKTKRNLVVNGVTRSAIFSYQVFYRGTNLRVFRTTDFNDGSPLKIDDLSIADPGVSVSNVFPVLAVDRAGNLYAAWSQSALEIYMATSTNRGDTWSTPVKVSSLGGTNIMPWIVAGDPGRVDVVWYRTPVKGNPDAPESTWEIFIAQSLNALDAIPTFNTGKVSQNIIHYGQICLDGLDCDISVPQRDRGFLEFPSITMDSKGFAVVVYNDNSNQVEGTYVMVAKQVGGQSLFAGTKPLKADPAKTGFRASDLDESGDARFPDHGAAIGSNIPALDIRAVSIADDASTITVTMDIGDANAVAMNTAAAQSGGDGLLYLVQLDFNDHVYWVAAEVRGGQPVFRTGTLGLVQTSSKKFVTYNPDLVASLQVQGSITSSPLGTGKITFRVPRSLFGNPVKGSKFYTVTGYAMSERGPLIPIGSQTVPDPSSLPVKVDASGAFAYSVRN